MTTIHFAEAMPSTYFQEGKRRNSLGLPQDLTIVDNAADADVIVARFLHVLTPYFRLNRQYFIWTHEPAFMPVTGRQLLDVATGRTVQVSSAWNGDCYPTPLVYFPFVDLDHDEVLAHTRNKSKDCVILATYRTKSDMYRGATNLDLSHFRQNLAIGLQRDHRYCDVFGRNWPETVTLQGESRGSGWHAAKHGLLEPYAFNLGCEKAVLPNYVTEKIWDSVRSGCVPIYFAAGTGIGELLGEGSYVDCSTVADADELMAVLGEISPDQRVEMVRSALNDYDAVARSSSPQLVKEAVVDVFVSRIRQL